MYKVKDVHVLSRIVPEILREQHDQWGLYFRHAPGCRDTQRDASVPDELRDKRMDA